MVVDSKYLNVIVHAVDVLKKYKTKPISKTCSKKQNDKLPNYNIYRRYDQFIKNYSDCVVLKFPYSGILHTRSERL